MQRRSFLQLLMLPALVSLRPRAVQAIEPELQAGLTYTDSEGTAQALLDVLKDKNLTTGIEYPS